MDNSAQNLEKTSAAKALRWMLAILVSAPFWALPAFIFLNLRRGLDVSDTGHYYNTLSQFTDIQSLSSQYFLFWKMLPIGEGVYANRVWVFALFFIAGGLFSCGVARFLKLRPRENPSEFAAIAIMWASVYSYYFWWLPDPSYNAVAVIILFALVGLVMGLPTVKPGRNLVVYSALTGFILAIFAVTRPTSAIVFLVTAAVFYVVFARPVMSRKTLSVLVAGLAGGLLFLLLAHIFIEPFSTTLDRQLAGLEMRQIRGRNKNHLMSVTRFLSDARDAVVAVGPLLVAAIGGGIFAVLRPVKTRGVKITLQAISALAILGIAVKFTLNFKAGGIASAVELSAYTLVLMLGVFGILWGRHILNPQARARRADHWVGAVLLLIVMPYCFAFGTGNLWIKQSFLSGGFLLSASIVMLVVHRKTVPVYWSASVLAALILVPFSVYNLAQNTPYRLPQPLSGQTEPVSLRGPDARGGSLFVDPQTARYLNAFGAFYDQMGPPDDRVHLIDLSGMSPFLHYHLNAKIMTVPWLIATEKKSQQTFAFILARMDPKDIRKAWILDAPDNKRHLDGAALRAMGINFPDDYEMVLTARPPFSKKDVHLYRPKTSNGP